MQPWMDTRKRAPARHAALPRDSSTTGGLRARHLAPRKGKSFSFARWEGNGMEGMRPRLISPRSRPARLPWRSGPLQFGGRRCPWARRPAVLFSCQRTRETRRKPSLLASRFSRSPGKPTTGKLSRRLGDFPDGWETFPTTGKASRGSGSLSRVRESSPEDPEGFPTTGKLSR